jgi:hypothetical protein
MDFDAVQDRVLRAGFGELTDVLAARAQPALRLHPASDGGKVGRLGGLPSLPEGNAWPCWRWPGYEEQPMTFVAEIDLTAIRSSMWPGPGSGVLSFFAAVSPDALYIDSGGAALVLRHSVDTTRRATEFPEALDDDLRYRELAVSARPVITLPASGETAAGAPFGLEDPDDHRMEAYLRLRRDLVGDGPHHLLLGCSLIDDESEDDEDVASRLWPSLHTEAVDHGLAAGEPPNDWRMLLQVSSDYEQIGTQFGDGGTLAFAIPTADLVAGRFDRVQAITDSL